MKFPWWVKVHPANETTTNDDQPPYLLHVFGVERPDPTNGKLVDGSHDGRPKLLQVVAYCVQRFTALVAAPSTWFRGLRLR